MSKLADEVLLGEVMEGKLRPRNAAGNAEKGAGMEQFFKLTATINSPIKPLDGLPMVGLILSKC